MGICAFFYMGNLFGVVVFQRSMLDWWRGWGQSAMGICAFCYMCNLLGVVMLHRSMVDWRGDICLKYTCIFQYVKLIWCSGFPEIYD